MSNELTAFFITIMNDLDDRERMYENFMVRRPEQKEQTQQLLGQLNNIKELTTTRARQFGLTVADDRKYIELRHQIGIAECDYRNLPLLEFGDFL